LRGAGVRGRGFSGCNFRRAGFLRSATPRPANDRDSAPIGSGTADALFAGMKDLLFVGVTLAFFALGWIYVRALDRL
jgi:hypothetical protein